MTDAATEQFDKVLRDLPSGGRTNVNCGAYARDRGLNGDFVEIVFAGSVNMVLNANNP